MALHLIKIVTDGNAKDGHRPQVWKADYLVTSRSPARAGAQAMSYWFDLSVERHDSSDPDSRYDLKFSVEFRMPSFRAALGRLARWARQLAIGIEECGELPEDALPLVLKSPSREPDGFGFHSQEDALAYAQLYSPALRVEERYYQPDGSPGGDGQYMTYHFVEVPPGEPIIIPAWGIPYTEPAYRGKPPISTPSP